MIALVSFPSCSKDDNEEDTGSTPIMTEAQKAILGVWGKGIGKTYENNSTKPKSEWNVVFTYYQFNTDGTYYHHYIMSSSHSKQKAAYRYDPTKKILKMTDIGDPYITSDFGAYSNVEITETTLYYRFYRSEEDIKLGNYTEWHFTRQNESVVE